MITVSSNIADRRQARPRGRVSVADLARWLVALAVASGAVVFSEPAPVDVLFLGLVILLPLAGLQAYSAPIVAHAAIWFAAGAGALLASMVSEDLARSATHTGVSFFLYAMCLVMSAFIAHSPERHTQLILRAYTAAALVAAIAGLIGYFDVVPGAEMFTKFGRAAGTFKDPNVFGPFLVPALLMCVHWVLSRSTPKLIAMALAATAVLGFALLLSFSRGAWFNLAISLAVYLYLSFLAADSNRTRVRLVLIGALGVLAVAAIVLAALQIEAVAKLLAERSALTQGYDVGPEGRFGGQEKAIGIALSNPLGIGATQFSTLYHHEDVHNVYISMFLNAGWLGGIMYLVAIVATLVAGSIHVIRATATRPLFLIAFAALIGNILEGAIVDTDHWRHFYLLLAIVWGLIAGETYPRATRRPPAIR